MQMQGLPCSGTHCIIALLQHCQCAASGVGFSFINIHGDIIGLSDLVDFSLIEEPGLISVVM
jgi:hypothetical protein